MDKKGGLHIVQVSWDDAVFRENGRSDARTRQVRYAAELLSQSPGSRMSIMVLARSPDYGEIHQSNLRLIPLQFLGRRSFVTLLWRLFKLHRRLPIRVLTCQDVAEMGWWVLFFGLLLRIPVVGQMHYDLFSPYAQRDCLGGDWKGRLRLFITLSLLPLYSALRVVGSGIRQGLIRRGFRKRIALIPVPVSMADEKDDACAAVSRDCATRRPVVLFVGRLVWQKNLSLWLRVASRIAELEPTARFRIIGEGPLRKSLEEQCTRLGLEGVVEFVGEVAYHQLSSHYNEASVFLLTSLYEGFGRVLAEAGWHHLPVVATRITGVEDIVDDGITGFLHHHNGTEEMARSAVRLLQDNALRERMGSAGHIKVRVAFDPDRLTKAWVRLLVDQAV
ncbi:MAG: glycosyltransferase family 4 protein [bacterium]